MNQKNQRSSGVSLPWSAEDEDCVLASMMAGGRLAFEEFSRFLRAHHFYDEDCAKTWARATAIYEDGVEWSAKVDSVSKGGPSPQRMAFPEAPQDRMVKWMDPAYQIFRNAKGISAWQVCRPILLTYQRRMIMLYSENLQKDASLNPGFDAKAALDEFMESVNVVPVTSFKTQGVAADLTVQFAKNLKIRIDDPESSGLPTHIPSLNDIIGGFRRGNLIVVGAMAGAGKTAFGVDNLWSLSKLGKKTLMISGEMTSEEIIGRVISLESGVSAEKILSLPSSLTELDKEAIGTAMRSIKTQTFFIDDTPMPVISSLGRVCNEARLAMGGLDLVIVDYLQYIRADRRYGSRQEEAADITKRVKALAKEFDVPVLAMAQLNREASKGGIPSLRHFMDTSQIEKEADIAIIICHDEDGSLIKIDKNRNGRVGRIEVEFNKKLMLFHDKDDSSFREAVPDEEEVF